MTKLATEGKRFLADVAALAALVWVAAATLHEGLGHGLSCLAVGGDPISWSTFHFSCGREALDQIEWRIVSAAGTAVNLGLMAIGYGWWRSARGDAAALTAWLLVVVNGLTSFGYFVFSAAFGIGDWNADGVLIGVSAQDVARAVLAVVGVGGYYAVVKLGAAMLSRMPAVASSTRAARRLCVTAWLTIGAVSLLAAIMAGSDWRSTIGASIGAALGGNAGLLSIHRFLRLKGSHSAEYAAIGEPIWILAFVLTVSFAYVLGSGLRL